MTSNPTSQPHDNLKCRDAHCKDCQANIKRVASPDAQEHIHVAKNGENICLECGATWADTQCKVNVPSPYNETPNVKLGPETDIRGAKSTPDNSHIAPGHKKDAHGKERLTPTMSNAIDKAVAQTVEHFKPNESVTFKTQEEYEPVNVERDITFATRQGYKVKKVHEKWYAPKSREDPELTDAQGIDELREKVHDMVDAYLNAGGPAECLIISQKDASRFREQAQQELLDELEAEFKKYTWGHYDPFSVINSKRTKDNKDK